MATCKTCGLLAIRHHSTNQPIEVIQQWRDSGFYSGPDHRTETAEYFCLASCASFPKPRELAPGEQHVDSRIRAAESIATEITCPSWMQWQVGKSPEKHEEMTILEQVRSEQAAYREEDRRWRQQVEALAETRHQELRNDQKASGGKTRAIALAAVIASAVSALIALTALLVRLL